MWLSKGKLRYIEAHFRRYSDAKLARALEVQKWVIRKAREKQGLTRNSEDKDWIRANPDAELPAYTGQVPRPEESVKLQKWDYLTAALCWLASMAVYWRTLGPTVTGEDGGELITAAYTLGIAHPPGYPLWCMLGKLFTMLLPVGTIAWRVNFMSAFFAATAVSLVCLLVIKLTRNRLAAAAGALALAFSLELWEQSVIAEVYSLNAFFVALCILLLLAWYETRKTCILYVFAAVYGLSLSNHNTMNILGPVFVLFILFIDREPWRRWRSYLACAFLSLLVASLVYLYLPIRSAADPPIDWGNPETFENFWDVVTRKQFAFAFTVNPRTPDRLIAQTGVFLKQYGRQFTPWLAWLPLLGLYPLWKRNKHIFGLMLAMFCLFSLGFIFILNFNLDKESFWVNSVFFIPAYLLAAIWLGLAIAWIASARIGRATLAYPAVALAIASILLPLAQNYSHNDRSQYYFAYDYGLNILKSLEDDAIYIPTPDHATFPALYLQAVEGVRPDVAIGNKYGYPEESLYRDMPIEIRGQFRKIPSDSEEMIIEDWIIGRTDRPVYFTKKRGFAAFPDKRMVTMGLVYKVVGQDDNLSERDFWAEYTWHTLDEADTRGDYSAELILSDYHFARGRDFLDKDENDKGLEAFDKALAIAGESKEGLNNLGSACAEHRLFDAAERYYTRALRLDPDYDLSLRNLGKVCMDTGKYDHALTHFERLLEKTPLDREANWLTAQCLKELGRVDDAIEKFRRYAQLVPEDDKVYREMGFLYFNEKRDPETARRMFARSLSLNPEQPELALLVTQQPFPGHRPFSDLALPDLDLPNVGIALPMPQVASPQIPTPQIPTPPGP